MEYLHYSDRHLGIMLYRMVGSEISGVTRFMSAVNIQSRFKSSFVGPSNLLNIAHGDNKKAHLVDSLAAEQNSRSGGFMSEQTVELEDVAVEAETDLALLCNIDDKKHWIPKSVVHEDSEVSSEGDTGTIVIMRWFGEKEGLV